MVEGRPTFVTALGATDTPGGWRENKAKGGVLMDVDSGEVIARGLSMPHSPRWYAGRLWVCESGSGGFGFIDLDTGKYEPVTEMPGFTRGLDFAGRWPSSACRRCARAPSSAASPSPSGWPKTSGPAASASSTCAPGRWSALLRFETAVQEVFAVTVLGRRFPDLINDDEKLLEDSFVVPTECLDEVAATVRK